MGLKGGSRANSGVFCESFLYFCRLVKTCFLLVIIKFYDYLICYQFEAVETTRRRGNAVPRQNNKLSYSVIFWRK